MLETESAVCQESGNAHAFDQIVRAYHPLLLKRARRLTRSHADAWDLVQDTFVRALLHAPMAGPSEAMRRWLLTVLSNLHVDRCRARVRRRMLSLREDGPLASRGEEESDEPLWRALNHEQVAQCVTRLAPHFRDAFVLHQLEGLSLVDTARRLRVAVGTAGTRVHRARRNLRTMLLSFLEESMPRLDNRAFAANGMPMKTGGRSCSTGATHCRDRRARPRARLP